MRNVIILFFLCFHGKTFASPDTLSIPLSRVFFHDKIAKEQKLIDKLDGKIDNNFHTGNNEAVNVQITDALFRKTRELNEWIETNEKLATNNEKVRFLSYVENALKLFRVYYKVREIGAVELPLLLNDVSGAMNLHAVGNSLATLVNELPYSRARIIAEVFYDNSGSADVRNLVYLKYCTLFPEKILQTIRPFADQPFADSLLLIAAMNNPAQLYSYSQSKTSVEGRLIHGSNHALVKSIAQLSQTPNALFYFPFLDNLLSGKQTIEEIKKYVGDGDHGYDSVGYYRLLIKTEKDYFRRMAPPLRDTPVAVFGANGLRETLKARAIRHFVTPINELHNESSLAVRMRAIDPLSPEELYFMMVMGEADIYTSSYKHSFNRMLQKMGPTPRTDSLLLNVHFDYFKKFIKMAANYNKLDTFLKLMPASSSEVLMRAFVANLDKTGNLEDAVDVADSYSSITDPKLLSTILNYVDENYRESLAADNTRGKIIYGLLRDIFLSADSNNKIDLTASLGIPSIYEVDRKDMQDDNGNIVQQVFFYGDEDGKTFFPQFVNSFSPKDWQVTQKKEWVEIKSNKGNVHVFVNRPLDNDANLDDSAQVHLNAYLESIGMQPSVVVHRGHSYWLPRTISRLPGSAKIVLLGSCGGYKNLNEILEVCPDAHIISTKEIGKGDLNQPIINYLNKTLSSGEDVVWKAMWANLSKQFENAPRDTRESWEDYIPPYKNLGAIFIKAYHKKTEPE